MCSSLDTFVDVHPVFDSNPEDLNSTPMRSLRVIGTFAFLFTVCCCTFTVGCGGSGENQVVAPEKSDDALRAETEAKLKALENVDPASL